MFCLTEMNKGIGFLLLGAILLLNYLSIIKGVDLFAAIALMGYGFYKIGGVSWLIDLFKKKEQ